MRGEGNWGAERRRSGKRPTRVDRVAVGSGNRGASGETDERNGRKGQAAGLGTFSSHVGLPSADRACRVQRIDADF